jgi:hypothetical protein
VKDVEISQLFYHAQAIYDAPWNSGVHFGCECGCGGDGYTSEDWDYYADAEKEAVKFFKSVGVRVMAGEVPV